MISNGELNMTTGEFLFESEFIEEDEFHVELSDDATGENIH